MLGSVTAYGPDSTLVKVLSRAVPYAGPIREVWIARRRYWGDYIAVVFPEELEYWSKFMRKYPRWKVIGRKHDVTYLELLLAFRFPNPNDFFVWLGKTVDATGVTAKLLTLTKGK